MHSLTVLKIDTLADPASLFIDLISRSSSLQELEMVHFSDTDPPSVITVLKAHPRLQSIKVYEGSTSEAMARRLLLSCGNLDKVFLEDSANDQTFATNHSSPSDPTKLKGHRIC
ncbi:hypothetical protein BGZ82_006302 [Podila clonocystis]|nr:hypothetical protein BGZ82_006302 [Podila clonocystis]